MDPPKSDRVPYGEKESPLNPGHTYIHMYLYTYICPFGGGHGCNCRAVFSLSLSFIIHHLYVYIYPTASALPTTVHGLIDRSIDLFLEWFSSFQSLWEAFRHPRGSFGTLGGNFALAG